MTNTSKDKIDSSSVIQQISSYFETIPEVVAVYVFGSRAKGVERKDSDIDLAVLLDNDQLNRQFELRKKYNIELSRILRKDLHILIMNELGESILAQIFKYGRCVVNRKPEVLSSFKMFAIAMIAEFEYYRKIAAKGFLKRFSEDYNDR